MAWNKKKSQDGIFSRPVGENETFIKLMGDSGLVLNREHWAINSTATIVPTGSFASANLAAHFRRAWAHLRFQHPSLAAEVDPDNDASFIYTVPADGAALDAWVSRTFWVAVNADSSADVILTFEPTPYAKLVYIPRSGELLVHTAHWRTDGIGGPLLLDALLTIASGRSTLPDPASLAWGTEVVRLAPSVEDAANMPKESTAELRERAAAYLGTFSHAAGAIGIPYLGDTTTAPGATRSATLVLSPETTKKIIAACKERGASMAAALHSSVAGANYTLADESAKDKHYASTIRFSLRPHLPEPYSTPAYAAGLYTTGWIKRVEAQASWADRLQEYQNEYRKPITRDYLDSHREYAARLGELIRNSPQGLPPPSDVDISSIGVADRLIQQFYGTPEAGLEVKAVSVGVEILTRQAVALIWTFRGQLNFNVVYNESFHSADQMNQFASAVKSQLLEGLGVQDS